MIVSILLILALLLLLINSLFRVSIANKAWTTPSGYKVCCILSARSNVFLIKTQNLVILVDTNTKRNQSRLEQKLKKYNIDKIDYLVLTHTHFDHAGNAAFIRQKYGARVIVHSIEKEYLERGLSPLPSGSIYITRFLIAAANTFKIKYPYPPCQADIAINGNYRIDDTTNISIIPSPGHSAGSVSVNVDNEILLVGDAMFGVFSFSILPPFADDTAQLKRTWKTLHHTGCKMFIPSHGSTKVHRDLLLGIKKKGSF